ncbi:isocitrate/isopropylmalate dehydrogenase family protein [Eubacteriaceae bacterium RF-744-FAT-4]|uniref:Isocitrate/isopropylmalate dehydrogenase family protein n=2 Tax=Pseudoramibacter porci TaxID=2606631 RepID=A0A7X2NG14_9FIRM|nr:isocitrate/isopropylmalate family dehydrogenase [Pseudoramibacter porci]MSS19939.1 isocitrate/isopropylmalate dehydrogenase family protein [Pseudoramibacter porci]
MISQEKLRAAQDKFNKIIEEQLARIDTMKSEGDFIDYSKKDHIEIGVVGGDGIGPFITKEAQRVLEFLLEDDIESNRVTIRNIDGLTIENRAACHRAIPDDVLAELKQCDVILKGPTTTPRKGDKWPNIESANVAMRKELDLFANLRPVKIPEEGVDWTFFRENTEGGYAVGSEGVNVNDDLAIDFTVTTQPGSERIIRAAFDYAQKSGKKKVTVVTKANVIKTTDGKFLDTAKEIAKEYPDVEMDDWYIDIMTAKLVDPKRRQQFKVVVLPNLYGDIITDEAAELQGGVGTAGSANIGKKHAMFEAIHGSAPRMVDEGRAQYADPSSIIKAAGMLLNYIGYTEQAEKLSKALQICSEFEKKVVLTGRSDGGTGDEFANYLMETLSRDDLEEYYSSFNK